MSWKKLLLPASAIPIIVLLGYGLTRDPNVIESPLPGRPAFDFDAPTLDGDTVRLADFKGKVVVLNFWASWCVACIEEHAYFVEAERRYSNEDLQLLGVVYQDTPENARRWMRRMGGSWPSVMDPDSRIAIDYGVYGVPETYFIGRDGRVAYKQIGPVSRAILSGWIDRLLAASAERDVATAEEPEADVPAGRSAGHVRSAPAEAPARENGGSRP